MALLCPECHHYPSGRTVEGQGHCFCKCHDVADAAPNLLAACKAADEFFEMFAICPIPNAEHAMELTALAKHAKQAVRAAIAEAEPHDAATT